VDKVFGPSGSSAGLLADWVHLAGAFGTVVGGDLLTVKFHQPSHEFTFGVVISFIHYPLVLTPLVQQVHSCMSVLEFSVYAGF
jgi:hypothetical protein